MLRPLLPLLLLAACSGPAAQDPSTGKTAEAAVAPAPPAPSTCPATAPAPSRLPGVLPQHETLDYWLAQTPDLDQVLLSPEEIARLNAAQTVARAGITPAHADLSVALSPAELEAKLTERLAFLGRQAKSGLRDPQGQPVPEARFAASPQEKLKRAADPLHIALAPLPVRCGPLLPALFRVNADGGVDPFDRNACSTASPQELVQVLGEWDELWVVRTGYAFGFVAKGDPRLSPPLSPEDARAVLKAPKVRLTQGLPEAPAGAIVPTRGGQVLVATKAGLVAQAMPPGSQPLPKALTRRAFLTEAFSYLGSPYGWGDQDGGRDCSRLVMDVLGSFGLSVPRFSAFQAQAGSFSVDVSQVKSDDEKALLLDEAAKQGVVLIHFPGHIMFYLGRNAEGRPMALHAFAEYLAPCERPTDRTETLFRVNHVAVTDLELGRGTSRRAFIERATRLTVFGAWPSPTLAGAATVRPAAPLPRDPCSEAARRSDDVAFLVTPKFPGANAPLRVVAATFKEPGAAQLVLLDAQGAVLDAPVTKRFGPPRAQVATLSAPPVGPVTAVLADGDQVLGCHRFQVGVKVKPAPSPQGPDAWPITDRWGPKTEALYATFVESLFAYPVEDERTWPDLDSLLASPDHNLLLGYLGQGEDEGLKLAPDCADLPYFLRAYFAWKLGLPFTFRTCSRARDDRPTRCGPPQAQAGPYEGDARARARRFIRREVMSAVQSSTARTRPHDEESDLYPVALTPEDLRPGTTYADPYGHTLVLVQWVPQTATAPGLLLAADAQPDATIGRRRFWRGSFLFKSGSGSGFKAFRPVTAAGATRNAALAHARPGVPRFDAAPYTGRAEDFYLAMEGLIDPRPLPPLKRMESLVSALEEVVIRRVSAIETGEAFMAERGFAPISMPKGADIFLTSGPWEDFATPSRDLRLLISVRTVLRFPDELRENPARFGVRAEDASRTAAQLKAALNQALATRTFSYVRSDGQRQTLTLADVVARREALEVAYNPNDCPERRWGAVEGSAERASCRREAPAAQAREMARVRGWFANGERPAR